MDVTNGDKLKVGRRTKWRPAIYIPGKFLAGLFLLLCMVVAIVTIGSGQIAYQVTERGHTLILTIVFLCAAIALLMLASRTSDVFSPYLLFPSVYLVALSVGSFLLTWDLAQFTVGDGYIPLTQWGYYALGIVAYLSGCAFTDAKWPAEKRKTRVTWNLNRLLIIIVGAGTLGILAQSYVYWQTGIPLLSSVDINAVRTDVRNVGGLVVTMFWLVDASLQLVFYYLLVSKGTRWQKLLAGMFLLLFLLVMIAGGSRKGIAVSIAIFAVIYHYTARRIPLHKVARVGLLVLILVGSAGAYRTYVRWGDSYLYSMQDRGLPPYLLWLHDWSRQISMGPDGLAYVLDIVPSQFDYRYGWSTMTPIRYLLPGQQQNVGDWIKELSGGTWTGYGRPVTMLGGFYVDGGPIAIILGMFLVGFIIRYLHNRVRSGDSPIWLMLYAVLLLQLIVGVRSAISSPYEMFWAPLIFVTTHFLVRRKWHQDNTDVGEAE